jgi:plastocyanin
MRIRIFLAVGVALLAAGAGVRAGGTAIDQAGQQFSERSLALKPGDRVTFANRDDVTHNISVVTEDDDETDLGLQKPGQTLAYKFDKAGRFKVRCHIHPGMKMTVNVH